MRPTLFGNWTPIEFRKAYVSWAPQSSKHMYQKDNQVNTFLTWKSPKFKLTASIRFIFKAHQL